MKVYLNSVTGIDDALVSLLMSKRSWTREEEEKIREATKSDSNSIKWNTLVKYGIEHGHTTLLRFIDVSFTVEGLHRGAQD